MTTVVCIHIAYMYTMCSASRTVHSHSAHTNSEFIVCMYIVVGVYMGCRYERTSIMYRRF
jgi:hypothetical protein